MTSPDRRIAAVVVTFNRLEMLQRWCEPLVDVPEFDEILVSTTPRPTARGSGWQSCPMPGCWVGPSSTTPAAPVVSTTVSPGPSSAVPTWSG